MSIVDHLTAAKGVASRPHPITTIHEARDAQAAIETAIGFAIEMPSGCRTLALEIAIAGEGARAAVMFDFKDADGALLDHLPAGLAVSAYGKPFFYHKPGQSRPRAISLPDGCASLDLHLVNWSPTPFHLELVAVAADLTTDRYETLCRTGAAAARDPATTDAEPAAGLEDASALLPSTIKVLKGHTETLRRLEPGQYYEHQLRLRPNGGDPEGLDKLAVLLPRFYDASLRPITRHDNAFPVSDKLGDYVYLSGGDLHEARPIAFTAPEGAKWYGSQFQNWRHRDIIIERDDVVVVGLTRERQIDKLQAELKLLEEAATGSDVVLIYTGTTRLGEKNRANRSMMLARELAARGKSVVYVYYRSLQSHSVLEPQGEPDEDGGRIVQMPNDLFPEFSDQVARLGRDGGWAILSIPDAGSLPLLNHLKAKGWRCAYEARDDWEEFFQVGAAKWYDTNFERYLARNTDFTLSVSPPLRAKLISMGAGAERSHILANGAGRLFHERALSRVSSAPAGRSGRTRIGYFGHLTMRWFDWPAVLALARARPDLEIEIVGHGEHPQIDPPNIRMLGHKSHTEIIDIAGTWDVGLIPFVPSRLSNAVDPIKIYEYFCLDLKVVSVFMEQIETYPNLRLYRHSHEVIALVDEALRADFDGAANRRFVQDVSWRHRAEELARHFEARA